MFAHAVVVCAVVGVGFPLFIFLKTRALRRSDELLASSPFSSLFEWYTPEVPYFEAVQLLRRASLILASTVVSDDAIIQASVNLFINATFFASLIWFNPLVYFPSKLLWGRNLFLSLELLSTSATMVGNAMALVGSFFPAIVNEVGIAFAAVNISFALIFLVVFTVETNRQEQTLNKQQKQLRVEVAKMVGRDARELYREWKRRVATIDEQAKSKDKSSMVAELHFLRSLEKRIQMQEKRKNAADAEQVVLEVLAHYDDILTSVRIHSERYVSEGHEIRGKCDTVRDIADREKLVGVLKRMERAHPNVELVVLTNAAPAGIRAASSATALATAATRTAVGTVIGGS